MSELYTDEHLYGAHGRPHASDIAQGNLGDCYYIAPLGALAQQQPQTIQHAIRYNAHDHSFSVQFYKEGADHHPHPVTVTVTQSDLQGDRDNLGVDSERYWHKHHPAPLWPEVMESAYAKFKAEHPHQSIHDELQHIGHGGRATDTLYALTGQRDSTVPAQALHDQGKAYTQLRQALQEGRPLLLTTNPMKAMPHDGLVKGDWNDANPARGSGHAYMLEQVYRDAHGEVMLTVRNPWGHNKSTSDGVNSPSATVNVKLKDIINNGHLQSIDIGPAAPAQKKEHAAPPHTQHPHTQHPSHSQSSQAASLTGDAYMDKLLATLGEPAAFKQALTDLSQSHHGQAFRAEGQAMHAEQQTQQQEQERQQQQLQQQTARHQHGPVHSR